MRYFQVLVAALVLASPSYVWAATPKAFLGDRMPAGSPTAKPGAAPAGLPAGIGSGASGRAAARFTTALDALQPEARSTTRGAKEVQVYLAASPAVVLVVSEDGMGSGALITADGKILTNLHVVGESEEVGVIFKPRVEGATVGKADVRPARVIRRDEVADLALLQVGAVPAGVKPLVIGSAAAVQVGSDVHAIGHPTGEAWTYTRGIVSQIRKDYAWSAEDRVAHKATVIQTQTPINPGNSGGPLLSDNLEIVGVNSFKGEGEGLNFAVSGDDVKLFLARDTDRLAAPARPARASASAAAGSGACKATALDERPADDPKGTEFLIDDNCDGEGDYLFLVPDDDKEPWLLMSDDDGDGEIDTVIIDEGRDGKPDLAIYDTDGDGEVDLRGEFRPGENEPYRFERVRE
jgi:S1-C subfamily serine protease